jgi:biopolymer transport protein ExbB
VIVAAGAPSAGGVWAVLHSVLGAMPAGNGNEQAAGAAGGMSMLEFIQAGGTIGYVIILLSLVALALAVVHLIRIRGSALAPESVVADLRDMLATRRVDDAIAYCERPDTQCFLTNVMRGGLLRYRRSPFGALELKAALEEAGQEQVSRLSRSTDGLALVASIAPMLGLLGTVVGINGAFATISRAQGFTRPDQLAGDISLALVTTIMGLVLAIPATAAVTYFRNKIERLAADIAVVIDELAIYVEAPSGGGTGGTTRAAGGRVAGHADTNAGGPPSPPRSAPTPHESAAASAGSSNAPAGRVDVGSPGGGSRPSRPDSPGA